MKKFHWIFEATPELTYHNSHLNSSNIFQLPNSLFLNYFIASHSIDHSLTTFWPGSTQKWEKAHHRKALSTKRTTKTKSIVRLNDHESSLRLFCGLQRRKWLNFNLTHACVKALKILVASIKNGKYNATFFLHFHRCFWLVCISQDVHISISE